MEVMITVFGETPTEGEMFHCADAYATVVSVDTQGNPVEVPFELAPVTPAEQHRCRDAADRSVPPMPTASALTKPGRILFRGLCGSEDIHARMLSAHDRFIVMRGQQSDVGTWGRLAVG
jgi:hypothetical protein